MRVHGYHPPTPPLGHEAGHGTLSQHKWVNHVIGYTLHTVSILLEGMDAQLIFVLAVSSSAILRLAGNAQDAPCQYI